MAGATQADRAAHDESGGLSRSRRPLRDRPVGRASIRRTVAWRGAESGRCPRRWRDRACRHGIRARADNGLVVLPGGLAAVRRDLLIALAAQHRLPAVYPYRYYVTSGG